MCFFAFFGAKIWPAAADTGELGWDLRDPTLTQNVGSRPRGVVGQPSGGVVAVISLPLRCLGSAWTAAHLRLQLRRRDHASSVLSALAQAWCASASSRMPARARFEFDRSACVSRRPSRVAGPFGAVLPSGQASAYYGGATAYSRADTDYSRAATEDEGEPTAGLGWAAGLGAPATA